MNKKLTEKEIKRIEDLRLRHQQNIFELGEATVQKEILKSKIQIYKEKLLEFTRYEEDLINELKNKYPKSRIDFETFEVIPKED